MIFKTSNFGIFLLFQVPPKIMKYSSLYSFFSLKSRNAKTVSLRTSNKGI